MCVTVYVRYLYILHTTEKGFADLKSKKGIHTKIKMYYMR